MQKTIGGDRIGSGKKMKVQMKHFERSTHDLSYLFTSTMSSGTLVPFLVQVAQPGDTFDIDLNAYFNTHPTIGPLFNSFKVQLDVYQCPIRLYQGKLHNNALNIGNNMASVKLPLFQLMNTPDPTEGLTENYDIDNSQINPSSVLAYLGLRGIGRSAEEEGSLAREFNACSWIALWDIYKNYYANKQEEEGAVIHTDVVVTTNDVTSIEIVQPPLSTATLEEEPGVSAPISLTAGKTIRVNWTPGAEPTYDNIMIVLSNGQTVSLTSIANILLTNAGAGLTVFEPKPQFPVPIAIQWRYRAVTDLQQGSINVERFPLSEIDDVRNEILMGAGSASAILLNSLDKKPWSFILNNNNRSLLSSQEGLPIKTYQSDLFNNWMQTEWIDGPGGINEITSISTAGDSFSLDQLLLSRKVYDMLNRIAIAGGTYDDWQDAVYNHERYTRCETPMYMGGLIKELVFQEVVSNNGENGTETGAPLGTLAGKGGLGQKHKGGQVTIKVDELSYIIGLVSLTPRIVYSQGNKWDLHLKTMDDFHKPDLDEIGFQDLITEQMAWWSTYWDGGDNEWRQLSAGKQPAWLNYMTEVNRAYGNFAIQNNEMFMTLNRKYEPGDIGAGILDLTTYIDPSKYNNIFAQTSLDSQNFWCQLSVDMIVRRKISGKLMPNL